MPSRLDLPGSWWGLYGETSLLARFGSTARPMKRCEYHRIPDAHSSNTRDDWWIPYHIPCCVP
jgi:hypothetical protein